MSAIDLTKKRVILFWQKVKIGMERECWEWQAGLSNGYGFFSKGTGKYSIKAHRYSYEFFNGPIPEGLVIDHICRNRKCVNPLHLRAVTPQVNATENSDSAAAMNKAKTHCKRGHEFSIENTYYRQRKGKEPTRDCRKCRIHFRPTPKTARRVKNTTGYMGISIKPGPTKLRYQARFKLKYLGRHEDPKEAAKMYDREALRQLGDSAKLNFPELREQYKKETK